MNNCPFQGYFSDLGILELAQQLRQGQLSAVQVTQACLNSIAQFNQDLNAFCIVDEQAALNQAKYADQCFAQGIELGVLQGIPVAVKDNIETVNLLTSMGSALFKDYRPQKDAECVKRLKQAGAIIVGKTNTHEFAYGPTGDCSYHAASKNPWNIRKISGGSSGGSAVAAGLVPIAIGTDTGGSIRIPAALTGVMGFKPSYARCSMRGVYPLSPTLDHLGIIAKSAAEIKVVAALLQDQARQIQASSRTQGQAKVAWLTIEQITKHYDRVQYQQVRAKIFELFAAQIEEISQDLASVFYQLGLCFNSIQNAEAYNIHRENLNTHPQLYQTEVRERLNNAKQTRAWEYIAAKELSVKLQLEMDAVFEYYDFLIMPTLPIAATDLNQRYIYLDRQQINIKSSLLSLTSPWNVLGYPVCQVPLLSLDSMPVGVQIIAKSQDDARLIDFVLNHFK